MIDKTDCSIDDIVYELIDTKSSICDVEYVQEEIEKRWKSRSPVWADRYRYLEESE